MKYLVLLLIIGCSKVEEKLCPIVPSEEEIRDLNERYYEKGCLDLVNVVQKQRVRFEDPEGIRGWCRLMSVLSEIEPDPPKCKGE